MVTGCVDLYGYVDSAKGWFISGWISRPWDADPPERIALSSSRVMSTPMVSRHVTRAMTCPTAVSASSALRRGTAPAALGRLSSVNFAVGSDQALLYATPTAACPLADTLRGALASKIAQSAPGPHRDVLATLLARAPYRGEDTLDALSPSVFLQVDEAIRCGPTGLALMGWYLAASDAIRAIRVRSRSHLEPVAARSLDPSRSAGCDRGAHASRLQRSGLRFHRLAAGRPRIGSAGGSYRGRDRRSSYRIPARQDIRAGGARGDPTIAFLDGCPFRRGATGL